MQTRFGAGVSPMNRSLDAFMDESVAGGAGALDDGLANEDWWGETERLRVRFFPADRKLTLTTRSATLRVSREWVGIVRAIIAHDLISDLLEALPLRSQTSSRANQDEREWRLEKKFTRHHL